MTENTNLNKVIDGMDPEKAKYDKNIKEFLSDVQVLSRIAKYTVAEVSHMEINDIIKCIDQSSIHVGKDRIDPGLTNTQKIESVQTEDSAQGEGYITYDIRFALFYGDEKIKIIINIEAQKSTDKSRLGYRLENRVVYYLSRLISSQKEVEFVHSDYDDIKKVYSIWICMDAEDEDEGISKISLNVENVYGKEMVFTELDKMCGIVIRIRKDDGEKSKNNLIAMLEDLLSAECKEHKKRIMVEKYGMVMTRELERSVDAMCNLSTVIEEKGIEKGESLLGTLITKLFEVGRAGDAELAAKDEEARKKFYKEFGLID